MHMNTYPDCGMKTSTIVYEHSRFAVKTLSFLPFSLSLLLNFSSRYSSHVLKFSYHSQIPVSLFLDINALLSVSIIFSLAFLLLSFRFHSLIPFYSSALTRLKRFENYTTIRFYFIFLFLPIFYTKQDTKIFATRPN